MTSPLPTDYGRLARDLHKRAAVKRQPVNGTFELTERCNLRCRMCYVRASSDDVGKRRKELSASEWLGLARDAVDNGMVFLLLTGGEVFLRPDFFEIYTPLTRMGLMLTLFTNGTLITDALAQRLAQAPPSRTEITLYGATAATYEAVTGIPGSYARCCAGIEALVRHGVSLRLKATISRLNVGEVDAMRQMAHNWGVPFSGGWLLSQRRDGNPSDIEDCRLPAGDGDDFSGEVRAMFIPCRDLMPVVRAALARGQHVRMTVYGRSMFPFVRHGDVVEIAPMPDAPVLGTVLLVRLKDERYRMHRVVAQHGARWLLRGDNHDRPDDFVTRENLLGVVTRVERNGRTVRFGLGRNGRVIGWFSARGWLLPLTLPMRVAQVVLERLQRLFALGRFSQRRRGLPWG